MSVAAHSSIIRDSRTGLPRKFPPIIGSTTAVYDQRATSYKMNSNNTVAFAVRHLASFSNSESDQSIVDPDIGVQKLLQIYRANVPEPLACLLRINGTRDITVTQISNNTELERFPLDRVESPKCRDFRDPKIPFKNVVMFKVNSPCTELHIFEAMDSSSSQVAESISKALSTVSHNFFDSPNAIRSMGSPTSYSPPFIPLLKPSRNPMDTCSVISHTNTRNTDREIYLLNRCFDDIERFMKNLQNIAKSYKEMKQNTIRSGKTSVSSAKSKKSKASLKYAPEPFLATTARLPPIQDFEDCLKKMKLSLILVSRLQGVIKNPNNAELVHYLFRPLKVIVDSTRDTVTKKPDLASKVVSPLLTRETILLLKCCLDSKEEELWNSLGEAWTLCREDWNGYVPPYLPRFWDGYQPIQTDFEESLFTGNSTARNPVSTYSDYEPYSESTYSTYRNNRVISARTPVNPNMGFNQTNDYSYHIQQHNDPVWDDRMTQFAQEVIRRGGKALKVTHNRVGKNDYELTVQKGEVVECLNDSRNWWKLRNSVEAIGYCPKNILAHFSTNENGAYSNNYMVDGHFF